MDSDKHIEELLQRYWLCETSVEEEAQLRAFFSSADVPAHLCRYKAWFAYADECREEGLGEDFDARVLDECREEGLGEDFDARVLAAAGVPVVKAKRVTLTSRFLPLFKAVAVVAVVVGLGGVVQRSFFADVEEVTGTGRRGATLVLRRCGGGDNRRHYWPPDLNPVGGFVGRGSGCGG